MESIMLEDSPPGLLTSGSSSGLAVRYVLHCRFGGVIHVLFKYFASLWQDKERWLRPICLVAI